MKKMFGFLLAVVFLLNANVFAQKNDDSGGDDSKCENIFLPYYSSFESDEEISFSDCFTVVSSASMGGVTYPGLIDGAIIAHTGTKCCLFRLGDGCLALPYLGDWTDLSYLRVQFYAKSNTSNAGNLFVGYLTDVTDASSFVQVQEITAPAAEEAWTELLTVSFEGWSIPSGSYIAFRYEANPGSVAWWIDDIKVDYIPNCTGIEYASVSVSNVEENSATVSFDDYNSAHNKWKVFYKKYNDTDWSSETTEQKQLTLNDLETATPYDVFVTTVCGNETSPDTSRIVSFCTSAKTTYAPFELDFSDETLYDGYIYSVSNSVNRWSVGSATGTGDTPNAMYISTDGGETESIEKSIATNAYAALTIEFDDEFEQTISFDYQCHSTNRYYGSLTAFLISADEDVPTSSIPSDAIVILDRAVKQTDWATCTYSSTELTGKAYKLVFFWLQSSGYSYVNTEGKSAAIDNITVSSSSCLKPSDVTLSELSYSSVRVSWTDESTPDQYKVYYKRVTDENWEIASTNDKSILLTDLDPETDYILEVAATCQNNESAHSDAVSFKTRCEEVTELPWARDFDDKSLDCWIKVKTYQYFSEYPYVYFNNTLVFYKDNVIATPMFAKNINELRVAFDVSFASYNDDETSDGGTLSVGVMSDPTDANTFEEIATVKTGAESHQVIEFTDAKYTVGPHNYVAFKFVGATDEYAYIDNVVVSGIPTCPGADYPLNVSDITDSSAVIEFTDSHEDHTDWNVYYQAYGAEDAEVVRVQTKTVTIDLEPSTQYSIWVKALCFEDDESDDATEIKKITTKARILNPDFEVNFEDAKDGEKVLSVSSGTNRWVIGKAPDTEEDDTEEDIAANNTSLYVSQDDGESFTYTNWSATDAYAVLDIQFGEEVDYTIAFDYKVGGEAYYDYLSVFLIDGDKDIPASGEPEGQRLLANAHDVDSWAYFEYKVRGIANASKRLVFYWQNQYGNATDGIPAAIDNIKIIGEACGDVRNFVLRNRGNNTAEVSWSYQGADTYTVEYIETQNQSSGQWTSVVVNDTVAKLTGLTPGTDYTVTVHADCGNNPSGGYISFRTFADVIVVGENGYTQNFENASSLTSLDTLKSSINHWLIGSAPYDSLHSNGKALYISDDDQGSWHYSMDGYTRAYASFPIQFGDKPEYSISFDYIVNGSLSSGYDNERLYVYLLPSTYELTSDEFITASDSALLLATSGVVDWTAFKSNPLWNVAGKTYQLVFCWYMHWLTEPKGNNPPPAIDNIKIVGYDCSSPADLELVKTDKQSATISWKETGTAEKWTVYYRTLPEEEEKTVVATDVEMSEDGTVTYTLIDLKDGQKYAAYVYASCDKRSAYPTNEIIFGTPGEVIKDFPYELTFENSEENNVFEFRGSGVNQWFVGDATGIESIEYDQEHALYISDDMGKSNHYSIASSEVYAAMTVQFGDNIQYQLDFDYHVGGCPGYDFMEVYLVDNEVALPTSGKPTGTVLLKEACGVNSWVHYSCLLEKVTGKTYKIVFYWKNGGHYLGRSKEPAGAVDNIRIVGSDCAAVSDITLTEKTTNSLDFTWKDNNESTESWTVYYKQQNWSEYEDSVTVYDKEVSLSGLNAGTYYDVYVVANCSRTSHSVTSYILASTECAPIEALEGWYEPFSVADNPYDGIVPKCWTRLYAYTFGGTQYPYLSTLDDGYGGGSDNTRLIFDKEGTIATPFFESDLSNFELSVDIASDGYIEGIGDYMAVGILIYVADDLYDSTTWEAVDWIKFAHFRSSYQNFKVPLTNIINKGGNKAIILKMWQPSHLHVYCDNFRLTDISHDQREDACSAPEVTVSNVIATEDGVSIVADENSATITWNGDATDYYWDYKLTSYGQFYSSNLKSRTFTGLTPGTEYTVYVRTRCTESKVEQTSSGNDTVIVTETGYVSPWKAVTFKTAGLAPDECPRISNLTASDIQDTEISVEWTADRFADSKWQIAISDLGGAEFLTSNEIQTVTESEKTFTSLQDAHTYTVYVRQVCEYNYSEWDSLTVTTLKTYVPADVLTVPQTDLTHNSVKLRGKVTPNDDTVQTKGFEFKLANAPVSTADTYTPNTEEFEYTVTDLDEETDYSYRAYITNQLGVTLYGDWVYFTTDKYMPVPPTVTTLPVLTEDLDSVSVVLYADAVAGEESILSQGFRYRELSTKEEIDVKVTQEDEFVATVTGLKPSTEYKAYAYVTTATYNGDFMVKGNEITFMTLDSGEPEVLPLVATNAATNISYDSATLHAVVQLGNVAVTEHGFVYKSSAEDSVIVRVGENEELVFEDDDFAGLLVAYTVKGLTAETQYTFYAYVKAGGNIIAGEEKTFTTLAEPIVETDPVVRTADASGIDSVKATLNAAVTVTETSKAIVSSGFMYRKATDSEYTTVEAAINNGTMTYELTGLTPDTEYQFAGFVNTADGHLMGDIKTFKTLATSGLAEIANMMLISTYPNPTTSDATLRVEGLNADAQVIMTNTNGQIISTKTLAKGQTEMRIETSGLAAGVYYIRVISDGVTRTEKLIKE